MSEKRKRRGRHEGSIYQRRDGRWVGSKSLGYGRNGKRVRRIVYGKTKQEVQQKLGKIRETSNDRMPSDVRKLTVTQLVCQWIDREKEPSKDRSTVTRYRRTFRSHVEPYFRQSKVNQLSVADVEYWQEQLADVATDHARRLALIQLRGALEYALKRHYVQTNVAKLVSLPAYDSPEMTTLTAEQVHQLLEASQEHWSYPFFATAIGTGMRFAELTGLQWDDVNFAEKYLSVQRARRRDGSVKGPKTRRSRRRIDLPELVIDALQSQRQQMLAQGMRSDWVFPGPRGGMPTNSYMGKVFKTLLSKAGLPLMRIHDCRHTHATILLADGENPKTVAERLGDSVATVLSVYAHVTEQMQQNAVARLNRLLG